MGLGKKMGFPTINISYKGAERGVFAGMVDLNGATYKAAINVGPKPTFNVEDVFVEAYLIELDDIEAKEGEVMKVELVEKIRDVKKFDSSEELIKQITSDVEFVRNLL